VTNVNVAVLEITSVADWRWRAYCLATWAEKSAKRGFTPVVEIALGVFCLSGSMDAFQVAQNCDALVQDVTWKEGCIAPFSLDAVVKTVRELRFCQDNVAHLELQISAVSAAKLRALSPVRLPW